MRQTFANSNNRELRTRGKAFCLLLLLVLPTLSFSQSALDRLNEAFGSSDHYDARTKAVKAVYDEIIKTNIELDKAYARYYLGHCYVYTQKYDEGCELLNVAADSFIQLEKFDYAGASYRDLAEGLTKSEKEFDAIDIHTKAYECYLKANDVISASSSLESQGDLNYFLGMEYDSQKSYQLALSVLGNQATVDDKGRLYYKRGEVLRQNQQFDEALDQLLQVYSMPGLASADNRTYFFVSLGNLYLDIENYVQAIQNYQTALMGDSENLDILPSLGVAYAKVGDTARAQQIRSQIRSIIAKDDSQLDAFVFYQCGLSAELSNDSQNAFIWYTQGLKYDSDREQSSEASVWCFNAVAKTLLSKKDSKALADLVKNNVSVFNNNNRPEVFPVLLKVIDHFESVGDTKSYDVVAAVLDEIYVSFDTLNMMYRTGSLMAQMSNVQDFEKSIDRFRRSADFYTKYGKFFDGIVNEFSAAQALAMSGKPIEAEWRYKRAVKVYENPEYTERSIDEEIFIASNFYYAGYLKIAEKCIETALGRPEIDADQDARARIQLFRIHYRNDEYELAINALPKNPPANWVVAVAGRKVVALVALNRGREAIEIGLAALPSIPTTGEDAELLNNIGSAYAQLNEDQNALKYYELSVNTRTAENRLDGLVVGYSNLGAIHGKLGNKDLSIRAYLRGYALARMDGTSFETVRLLENLGNALIESGDYSRGVYYLKKCLDLTGLPSGEQVNESQYSSVNSLSNVSSKSFALAVGLAMERRFSELHRAVAQSSSLGELFSGEENFALKLNDSEREYDQTLSQIIDKNLEKYREINVLLNKDPEKIPKFMSALFAEIDSFSKEELTKEIPEENKESYTKLSRLSALVKRPVVILRSINIGTQMYTELQTSSETFQSLKDFDPARTSQDIDNLLMSISTGTEDYKVYSQKLYELLIKPVEGNIPENAIVLWWPIDKLRTIPLAVLHDGSQFIAEKWASAVIPSYDSDLSTITTSDSEPFNIALFAATQGGMGYSKLPGTRNEVELINKVINLDRIQVAQDPLIDEKFTSEALYNSLRDSDINVLHLATHFKAAPQKQWEGELLLGNGKTLPLLQLVGWANSSEIFSHLNLVVLSACETELTGTIDQGGDEYDSLGSLLLALGAKSTMTTLWKINDQVTSSFMEGFYRSYGQSEIGKAVALQNVQKAMIRGQSEINNWQFPSLRGDNEEDTIRVVTKDPRHPHFWAPFILSGNPN